MEFRLDQFTDRALKALETALYEYDDVVGGELSVVQWVAQLINAIPDEWARRGGNAYMARAAYIPTPPGEPVGPPRFVPTIWDEKTGWTIVLAGDPRWTDPSYDSAQRFEDWKKRHGIG